MKIGRKLLLGAVGLTLVPLVITAALLWQGATSLSSATVDAQVQTQLSALRDTKSQQLRDEINYRMSALKALAGSRLTVEAMGKFGSAFNQAGREAKGDTSALQRAMLTYVNEQFGPEFSRRNPGKVPDLSSFVEGRDLSAIQLQHDYLVANPNKLGEKEKLTTAPGNLWYHTVHAAYHPTLERAQKAFGFYDIFLIDTTNDQVVYTVFKELDFGTNLNTGIAAKTKLAEAYRRMKNARSRDDSYLSDFEPYLPSYNDQAAFAAVPLFDGDKQVGVLAIQYPIDKISATMSSENNWSKIGLGASGDVFLIGADYLMRSNARSMVDGTQTPAYLKQLQGKQDAASLALAQAKKSTIGLIKVESEATRAAQAGESKTLRFTDYRGVPSVAAVAPFRVQGLNWSVVAQIDQAEADAPVQALSRSTLLRTLIIALLMLAAVGALMTYFLRRFMMPINRLDRTIRQVVAGKTTARSRLVQRDEIGDVGRAFDKLLDERIAALEKAEQDNERLNNSVINLLQAVFQLSNKDLTVRADVTEDVIGTLSASINQLTDATGQTLLDVRSIAQQVRQASESVGAQASRVDGTTRKERESLERMSHTLAQATEQMQQVGALSMDSSRAAERAAGATASALSAVTATVRGMDDLREAIAETEKRFKSLGERTQEISTAVSLINTLSDRTHMLAMNASMQAATAGEAGRGFTVVAEEVQRLSDSSRHATQQISQLVQNIQIEANETLSTLNRLIGHVVSQSDQAQRAGVQMTLTQDTTGQLVDLVRRIAQFAQQQGQLSLELQRAISDLDAGSANTVAAVSEQTASTATLLDFSRQLTQAVDQFKLS
jgi:methyl-accepting chemotaxis protein